MHQVGFKR